MSTIHPTATAEAAVRQYCISILLAGGRLPTAAEQEAAAVLAADGLAAADAVLVATLPPATAAGNGLYDLFDL